MWGRGSSHLGWSLMSRASRMKGNCILERRDIFSCLFIQLFKSSDRHLLKATSSETGKCRRYRSNCVPTQRDLMVKLFIEIFKHSIKIIVTTITVTNIYGALIRC